MLWSLERRRADGCKRGNGRSIPATSKLQCYALSDRLADTRQSDFVAGHASTLKPQIKDALEQRFSEIPKAGNLKYRAPMKMSDELDDSNPFGASSSAPPVKRAAPAKKASAPPAKR